MSPAPPSGPVVVDLGDVPAFPIPGVGVGELALMLTSVPVADVSDVALVNAVGSWAQVIHMAQAAQAAAVREIEARTVDALARVPDELACALVCTRRAAQDLLVRAWGSAQHPVLADAWAAGAIDARKVDVILAETATASPSTAALVVGDAVARAGELTAPQLRRHVRAGVLAADPDTAEKRRRAEFERRTVLLDPAPDAMARLIAYLPAAVATAAFTAIDALAGHAALDGDTRTVDQRRADAFADVFTAILDRQTAPDGTPLPRRRGQRVAVQVTVAASTLAGLDEHPATLGSYGPVPAQVARELAQDGTWRRILTDPTGQACAVGTTSYRPGADLTRTVTARDVTCTFPGCRQPATRCEIDHRTPYDHTRTTTDRAATARAATDGAATDRAATARAATDRATTQAGRPPGSQATGADAGAAAGDPQTCLENLHALCKHHHEAKTKGWWQVTWDRHTGVSRWTDRHGLTYARHPVPIHTTPDALAHRPRPPDPGDPPF